MSINEFLEAVRESAIRHQSRLKPKTWGLYVHNGIIYECREKCDLCPLAALAIDNKVNYVVPRAKGGSWEFSIAKHFNVSYWLVRSIAHGFDDVENPNSHLDAMNRVDEGYALGQELRKLCKV